MAELKKIGSFQTFSEMRSEQNAAKLAEEQSIKREQLKAKFASILDELNVDDVEIKSIEEGNAFIYAAAKAKQEGKDEFEFNGKTFKVTLKKNVLKESTEVSYELNEAIKITGKRGAKKVFNQLVKIWNEFPAFGANDKKHSLGVLKMLFTDSMGDANFGREGNKINKEIKGSLQPVTIKVPELKGAELRVPQSKLKDIIYELGSRVASAGDWGGITIVEGFAMYLDYMGETTMAQRLLDGFNLQFESVEIMESKIAEGNAFGAARAKAIAAGKDEFEHEGETFKVKGVDKEDEENAEEFVGEGAVKRFTMDLNNMIKNIKRGYGWISPEFVEDTWENTSDTIDFELVKSEIYKQLIKAGLLANADDSDEEEAGEYIKSLKQLGIAESLVNEGTKEEQIAMELYTELVGSDHSEYTEDSLSKSEMSDFEEIVMAKGHKGSKAKKIADEFRKIATMESVVTEAKSFSEREIKATAGVVADAVAKVEGTKSEVIEFETLDKDGKIAGFYIQKASNKKGAPSRYWITDSGEVVSAFRHDTFGDGVVAQVGDKLASVVKAFKANESSVNESFVAYTENSKGEYKVVKILKDQRAAKAWRKKNEYLLDDDSVDVQSIGTTPKKDWDKTHPELATESVVTEAKFDKKKLMKAMKADDGMIQLANGKEYIIYAYDNGNDENDAMWNDKSIFALDQDGEEHEVKYSDIVSYNEAEVKSDEEFKEYATTVLQKAFGEEYDEAKAGEVIDGILSKSDGDYGAAVGMLTSSLG